ncbi:MAG: hypothetical protein KatS3mg031_0155 [Chitinophagales bacterium]|nr:MAG: hypothetical protein KatS3mg031_0155 [Chitinophagales bacterium]
MGSCRQTFSYMRLKNFIISILFILLAAGCKKDDIDPPQDNSPTTALNGWSYHGKTKLLPNSVDDLYDLYLAKVHQHGSSYFDVFYGVRYVMPNYTGPGDGYFMSSTRWILKADGTTQRNGDSEEFSSQTTGILYEPVYYTFSGGPYSGGTFIIDYIHPVDVEVFGTGQGEFKVYNPGALYSDAYFSDKLIPGGGNGFGLPYYLAAGSSSPISVVSSPATHLKAIDRTALTQNFWGSFNMAMGTNTTTNQSFVLSVNVDSQLVIVNAVTPQDLYSPDYGAIRGVQPMFGKKIPEIIPQWNSAYQIEMLPYYYQYGNMLYVLFQNQQQLFSVTFNLNTFQFQVAQQYSQPRSVQGFGRLMHHFQWIDNDEGAFVFTEKRQDGVFALLHKNGTTQQIQLPQFKSSIAAAVADIHYDNSKYWMIVAENDKSLHLFSKNY